MFVQPSTKLLLVKQIYYILIGRYGKKMYVIILTII